MSTTVTSSRVMEVSENAMKLVHLLQRSLFAAAVLSSPNRGDLSPTVTPPLADHRSLSVYAERLKRAWMANRALEARSVCEVYKVGSRCDMLSHMKLQYFSMV